MVSKVISIPQYRNECYDEEKTWSDKMGFYRRFVRIAETEHVSKEIVLKKMGTKTTYLKSKRHRWHFWDTIREGGSDDFMLIGHIEGRKVRGQYQVTYPMGLSKWVTGRR